MEMKKAVKDTRKKTLDDAKILMSWLYNSGDDGIKTIYNLEKSFLEELKLMSGECIGTVEVFAEFADGAKGSGRALLRDVVKTGIELPADVANFYVDLKVLRSDKSERNIMGSYMQQIFKSDIFYVKENNKTQVADQGGIVIDNMDMFSSMSGNKIRFRKYEDVIEL